MVRLNKKLSNHLDRKLDQLEGSSIKYILAISLVAASLNFGSLSPIQNTLITIGLFWFTLSIDTSKRIFVYLGSILSAFYFLSHKTFFVGLCSMIFLMLLEKISSVRGFKQNFPLLLGGLLSHTGDLITTSIALQRNLSEENPFLLFLGNFIEISLGLMGAKTILFISIIYAYHRDFEGLNPILKIFLASGFILTLSNIQTILSGM